LQLHGQSADSTGVSVPPLIIESDFFANAFPTLPRAFGLISDTLIKPIGLLSPFKITELQSEISADWQTITIYEISDGQNIKMPFSANLNWYIKSMIQRQRQINFSKTMQGLAEQESGKTGTSRSGKSIELVGVDVGDLGRVSLRVRGNVSISGKMVFQDQELIRSNINQAQNTHIEFDQKQNLNIEGKIGDRITVLMDQDSERDFDWENNIRISYQGQEDEILQKIEAGNISLSLPSTQFVTFSGKNRGLFGLKAVSKLGPVDITTIASIEQTRKEKQKFDGSSEAKAQTIQDYTYIKDRYFFIHEWYRNGFDGISGDPDYKPIVITPFYPLDSENRHQTNRFIVKDFNLFKSVLGSTPGSYSGTAYVYPEFPDSLADYSKNESYALMERDEEYYINEDLGYIRLRSRAVDVTLACSFKIVEIDAAGNVIDTVKTIGSLPAPGDTLTNLQLKLIRPRSVNTGQPTWDLMFKNVYFLGTANINPDGFAVRIINKNSNPQTEYSSSGISFITLFGLDSKDQSGNNEPDQLIDMNNPNLVNMAYGEIIFPAFHPFADPDSLAGGNANSDLKVYLGSGYMYTTTNTNDIQNDSEFSIETEYSNQTSNISLGFMVVEGSEEVKLNGVTLQRGIDYQIDYFGGSLTFLNEEALAPNANLEVLYEKHELVSFDKKTIIGTRAQMDLGQNSFLGATALYYNQSVLNEKIEVGYEPTRNFIWDLNGKYQTELEGVTRFLDRLPMLETEKMTSISMEGEIAQVLPNPNPINNEKTGDPNGVAFIDDFEGSKRTTSPQVLHRYWKASAAPLNSLTGLPFSQLNRANLFWYNPYVPYPTRDIWPNQSVSTQAQNETTNILSLNLSHKGSQSLVEDDSVWAGITSPFFSGDHDQTRAKFFEIWLRGTNGKLTVDLGRISEDWNGNGVMDTEDKPESGFSLGNGFLDDEEDIGLDGCTDEYENGWGGCLDPTGKTFSEYLNEGESEIINATANPDDPNGDNWSKYTGGDPYKLNSPNGPHRVNGTEGNRRQEGGIYPDTEDIDGSGFLDRVNDYFTKSFVLDQNAEDADYVAGETVDDNNKLTGWRLYRIPLSHFSKIKPEGNIDWNDIRNIRLTMSGIDSQAVLQIAKIEMVGNQWLELGISSDTTAYIKDDSVFAVTIVNTEDNADYSPPNGVTGEYDKINKIRSKEQSLVLKFDNLPGHYKGAAEKTLLELSGSRAQSYLTYDRMKMFVYGNSPQIGIDETDMEMFLRFGRSDHFYEITQPVYEGWDEDRSRNSIDLDLEWLTSLKIADSTTVNKVGSNDTFVDSADVKTYYFKDANGALTGKRVQIQGSPSIPRISYIRIGIRNTSPLPASGEIWVDELRLSGVKKDRGVAMRVQGKLNLADLGSLTLAYSRRDADFHILQQRLGTNSTSEDFRLNASLSLHKFFPESWGIKLPITTSYSNSIKIPKYHPANDDILLNVDDASDSLLTLSSSVNFNTSLSKTTKSENILLKYTVDRINTGFSAKLSNSSSFLIESNHSESYSGNISYTLPFGKDNYIKPLKLMSGIPLIGEKMEDFNLYYTPTKVSAKLSFNESLSEKNPRIGNRPKPSYNLGLKRNYSIDYKLTESIKKVQYSHAITSDMDEFRGYTWIAIRDLDPGIMTNSTENFSTAFTPAVLEWLRPNFSYSANYSWNKPIDSSAEGANISNGLNFSSSMNLNPTKLFELVYKPKSAGSRGRRQPKPSQDADQEKKKSDNPILNNIYGFTKKITPVSIRYSSKLNRAGLGVLGETPMGYKFGWLPVHGQEQSRDVGTNTGDWNYSQDISFGSGLKITKTISTTLNYSQQVSSKIGGAGGENRNLKRDVFTSGEFMENSFPFPRWSLRWNGLQKFPILKKFTQSVSVEHGFSGSESRNWRMETKIPEKLSLFDLESFIAEYGAEEQSSKLSANFSPLLSVNMKLKKGITLNSRLNYGKTMDRQQNGQTYKVDMSLSTNATYNHKGGMTIPLPFMEDFSIQNNVNFTFNLDYSKNETQKRNTLEDVFTKPNKISKWVAGLRISYSFTNRVTGGLVYEYRETEHFNTGKNIDRDFGFDVKIAISG